MMLAPVSNRYPGRKARSKLLTFVFKVRSSKKGFRVIFSSNLWFGTRGTLCSPSEAKLLKYVARLSGADVGVRIDLEQEALRHQFMRGRFHRVNKPGMAAIELLK